MAKNSNPVPPEARAYVELLQTLLQAEVHRVDAAFHASLADAQAPYAIELVDCYALDRFDAFSKVVSPRAIAFGRETLRCTARPSTKSSARYGGQVESLLQHWSAKIRTETRSRVMLELKEHSYARHPQKPCRESLPGNSPRVGQLAEILATARLLCGLIAN